MAQSNNLRSSRRFAPQDDEFGIMSFLMGLFIINASELITESPLPSFLMGLVTVNISELMIALNQGFSR